MSMLTSRGVSYFWTCRVNLSAHTKQKSSLQRQFLWRFWHQVCILTHYLALATRMNTEHKLLVEWTFQYCCKYVFSIMLVVQICIFLHISIYYHYDIYFNRQHMILVINFTIKFPICLMSINMLNLFTPPPKFQHTNLSGAWCTQCKSNQIQM